jgi:hypothetical protein
MSNSLNDIALSSSLSTATTTTKVSCAAPLKFARLVATGYRRKPKLPWKFKVALSF